MELVVRIKTMNEAELKGLQKYFKLLNGKNIVNTYTYIVNLSESR